MKNQKSPSGDKINVSPIFGTIFRVPWRYLTAPCSTKIPSFVINGFWRLEVGSIIHCELNTLSNWGGLVARSTFDNWSWRQFMKNKNNKFCLPWSSLIRPATQKPIIPWSRSGPRSETQYDSHIASPVPLLQVPSIYAPHLTSLQSLVGMSSSRLGLFPSDHYQDMLKTENTTKQNTGRISWVYLYHIISSGNFYVLMALFFLRSHVCLSTFGFYLCSTLFFFRRPHVTVHVVSCGVEALLHVLFYSGTVSVLLDIHIYSLCVTNPPNIQVQPPDFTKKKESTRDPLVLGNESYSVYFGIRYIVEEPAWARQSSSITAQHGVMTSRTSGMYNIGRAIWPLQRCGAQRSTQRRLYPRVRLLGATVWASRSRFGGNSRSDRGNSSYARTQERNTASVLRAWLRRVPIKPNKRDSDFQGPFAIPHRLSKNGYLLVQSLWFVLAVVREG